MSKLDWFHWIQDPSLRAAADLVLNGGRLPQGDARRVFSDLQEESVLQIKAKVGDSFYDKHFPTDRDGPEWDGDRPIGLIDHYTAGISGRSTLKWFSSRVRGEGISNSSAHYVLDRDGIVLQLINPLERVAWHARGHSYTHVGIEHVNAGLLRKVNGAFRYLNVRKYPKDRVDHVQVIEGEHWEPYKVRQIVTNIVLKRWLIMAKPQLRQEGFIDHEMADPMRKRDCGPLWPLHDINALAFSDKPIRGMMWMDVDYLSTAGVFEFHREVQDYLRSA
jgi:N-acetyl-anhydromuramyl-L-alanine amidase AmpD